MPNGMEYQQSRPGANNFYGYINWVSDRKKTLFYAKFNGQTAQNKIDADGIGYML